MKTLQSLFVALFGLLLLSSCDNPNSVNSDEIEITYKVVDRTTPTARKEITYEGPIGGDIIVQSLDEEWESTFSFDPKRDAKLTVQVLSENKMDISIYIYKNGELVQKEESDNAYKISATYLN